MEQLDAVEIKKKVDRWGYLFGLTFQIVMLVDGIVLLRTLHPEPTNSSVRAILFIFTGVCIAVIPYAKSRFKRIVLSPKSLARNTKGESARVINQVTMGYICVFAMSNAPLCFGVAIFILGAGSFAWLVGLGVVSLLSFFWLRPSRQEIEKLVGEINLELRQVVNR